MVSTLVKLRSVAEEITKLLVGVTKIESPATIP
jgi:hypothetical protein